MLFAYEVRDGKLRRMDPADDISRAAWIDLWRPMPAQVEAVRALGVDVPSLEDMEEIEISNRLYREDGQDYLTVVLPGQTEDKVQVSSPVTFVVSPRRMVTIRHHAPRPFETFPERADKSTAGCASPVHLFLGLIEEIIGRLADLLETTGKVLDGVSRDIFGDTAIQKQQILESALQRVGRESEALGRVRLGLLTVERALSYLTAVERTAEQGKLRSPLKALMRDVQSLEVHSDFLSSRLANVTDTTLGMVNLAQNVTVRILSVVAALFLPPTLIGTVYGMNFADMPELSWAWGYPMAIGLMVLSAVITYLFLRWKNWL